MTSNQILTGRLHALERDGDQHWIYIYNGLNKPEQIEVTKDLHRWYELQFSDYLVYLESVGGFEYKSYSVQAQIEQDWGRDLAEQQTVLETQDALLEATR